MHCRLYFLLVMAFFIVFPFEGRFAHAGSFIGWGAALATALSG
jgi:hypothetical protein